MCGDDLLGNRNRIRCVADDQRVGALVERDVFDLEHRLQHVLQILRISVGDLKGANFQFLVFLLLGRRRRIDEQRVGIENLFLELVLQENQVNRVIDRCIADKNRGLEIGAHIAIKNHVQAGRTRQRLEHHAYVGIAKLQGHRLLHDRGSSVLRPLGVLNPIGRILDLHHQLLRRRTRRIFEQDLAQLGACSY